MKNIYCWLMALILAGAAPQWALAKAGGEQSASVGQAVARSVGEAFSEVGRAVAGGGGEVIRHGRSLWEDTLLPMFQRFAAAIPTLLKAIVLLVLFWIVAQLIGAAVSRALSLTKLDDRAVRDWGLGDLLKRADGSVMSLESLAGAVVKWIILLFGFVAFFNALQLQMVAGPLQGIIDSVAKAVPGILKAVVILFAYWAVASLARLGVSRVLGALQFDQRAGRFFPAREEEGKQVGPSELAGRLIFYLVLLFGIPPFLQALGQEALVAPLQDMLAKALGFIPNIFAAAIILVVGNIIAVIVREVVTSFLAAAGADALAERLGISALFGKQRLSGLAGIVVYVFIIVPIVVSALDTLQLSAISVPVRNTLEGILRAVPALLVATIIVFVGYAVARFAKGLVQNLLSGFGVDTLPERVGLDFLKPSPGRQPLSAVIGSIVMAVILLLTASQAFASLGFHQLASLMDQFVRYLPNLFIAIIILMAAVALSNFVARLVKEVAGESPNANLLGNVARYAVLFLGASMALDELGISQQIVTIAVASIFGGLALALGLAFGLGGKDRAKQIIERN